MPRIARLIAVGYPHHLTQRGNNREDVFFDDEDRKFYLQTLETYSSKYGLAILAYCLMTNHVHLLAIPGNPESLSKGLGSTHLVYTQYINRRYNRSGRLWQNRFFSSIIDREAYLWAVARYIESSPRRAHLVKRCEDYPWSSTRAHILGIKDNLLSREEWLAESDMAAYRAFLDGDDQEVDKSIKKAAASGRPLGGEDFVKGLERILGRTIIPQKPGRPKKVR